MSITCKQRRMAAIAIALGAPLVISGCASGFVSGGVATASASDGRVSVDSRTGSASIGPSGPAVSGNRTSGTVCVDQQTGTTYAC